MKLKVTVFILLFFLHFTYVNAQNQQVIDSLQNELKIANDTTEINLLNKIAGLYINNYPDSTFKYANIAIQEAKKINFEKGLAFSYKALGGFYFNKGKYDLAEKNYIKALKIHENNTNSNEIARILIRLSSIRIIENNNETAILLLNKARDLGNDEIKSSCNYSVAVIYHYIENYEKSLQYIFLSLEYYMQTGDSIQMANCYNVIGSNYSRVNNDSLALINFNHALEIHKENSKIDYAYILGNIGVIYSNSNNNLQAIKVYLQAVKILLKIEDIHSLANIYINLGNSYRDLNNFIKAEDIYNKARDIFIELNDSSNLALYYNKMGILYNKNNSINKSIKYLNKSIEIADIYENTYVLRNNYYELFNIYQSQNNNTLALEYHLKYVNIKDSIFSLEKEKSIDNLRISYETEKNKQTIDFLKIEHKLNTSTIKQQKRTEILLIIILIIIIVFSIILLYVYLQKNKAHRRLVLKDKEVILAENKLGISIKNEEKLIESHEKSNPNNIKLAEQILELIEKEQIYTKNNLTIHELADMLNTNQKYVSQTINVVFNKNFSNFINEYRVKKACSLFASTESHKYTIFAIAQKVGFKSHSSFISAFKKNTGVTPTFYIKNVLE